LIRFVPHPLRAGKEGMRSAADVGTLINVAPALWLVKILALGVESLGP